MFWEKRLNGHSKFISANVRYKLFMYTQKKQGKKSHPYIDHINKYYMF